MQSPSNSPSTEPPVSRLYLFIGAIAIALFVINLTGQPNLVDNERRVGAYVLDAIQNGHWMAQRDSTGDVASKPPMVTWIAAAATLACGGINRFAVYLPSALATFILVLVLLKAGREHFGWRAGFLAALAYLLSPTGDKVMQTARYDGLFALPVALAALAAYRAWTTGRGWTWFWFTAALATMVKGPLGLLLAMGGLLAAVWEWRGGSPQKFRGAHWLGILVFLLICGGWFWLAWREMGQPLIDKQIKRELVKHALKGSSEEGIGVKFWEPSWAYITLFLPWSIAGIWAFWRVVKHPSPDVETRRFERFLFCWFFVGLVVFSLAAHQRSRLVMPLLPAAALLAGRELSRLLDRWKPGWPPQALLRAATGLAVFVLAISAFFHVVLLRYSKNVQRTVAIQELAAELRRGVGAQFPLTYVDAPFALQFCLNTMRTQVSATRAAELLKGDAPAFVVVGDDEDHDALRKLVGTNTPLHELRRLTNEKLGDFLWILGNRPKLEWPEQTASLSGALRLETRAAKPVRTRGGVMFFERTSARGSVTISNQSTNTPYKLRVQITGQGATLTDERMLEPGASWRSESAANSGTVPKP